MRMLAAGTAALLTGFASSPATAADAEHGKTLYQACAACHTEGGNAIGPSLKGVFGRKSGAREDYRYSPAMLRANLVWDETNLKAFIADPQAKVKGNRMPFGGINDPKELDDVIAYLKVLN
jgi:cytochrome c